MNTSSSSASSNRRGNSGNPKERRRTKRSMLRVRADVTLPGDLTIESHTIDISASGLSFDVPYELQTSQHCKIKFDLKKFGAGSIETDAIVRNCRLNPEGKFYAGLEFETPPAELAAVLAKALV